MIVLGIESTAHTFSVSILKNDKILSLEKDMFVTKSKGLIPREIVEHHLECFEKVINLALNNAKIKISDINLISFSQSPGIGSVLQIGANIARTLSLKNNIPIVGVNHCIAHIEIARKLTKFVDPVIIYVSGANTQVIAYESGRYRIFGETLDMGMGNFIDHFGRELGIGFPAGKKIEDLAKLSNNYIKLPYNVKGMDVNFGGIFSNVKNKILSKKYSIPDLCYSVQETIFSMIMEVSERALSHCNKDELVIVGGVACNKRINEMAKIMCEQRGAKFKSIPKKYSADNAAMIAHLGSLKFNCSGPDKIEDTIISQKTRTDEVEICWRK